LAESTAGRLAAHRNKLAAVLPKGDGSALRMENALPVLSPVT